MARLRQGASTLSTHLCGTRKRLGMVSSCIPLMAINDVYVRAYVRHDDAVGDVRILRASVRSLRTYALESHAVDTMLKDLATELV